GGRGARSTRGALAGGRLGSRRLFGSGRLGGGLLRQIVLRSGIVLDLGGVLHESSLCSLLLTALSHARKARCFSAWRSDEPRVQRSEQGIRRMRWRPDSRRYAVPSVTSFTVPPLKSTASMSACQSSPARRATCSAAARRSPGPSARTRTLGPAP